MAQEKQRSFHHDRRVIEVRIVDDLGTEHIMQCYVGQPKCPHCQREYPALTEKVDFQTMIDRVCEELSIETGKVIELFEAHGADMTQAKARRAERMKAPILPSAQAEPGEGQPAFNHTVNSEVK